MSIEKFDYSTEIETVDFGENELFYYSVYEQQTVQNRPSNELGIACHDLVQQAVHRYPRSSSKDYMWNDKIQIALKQPVSFWQGTTGWDILGDIAGDFVETALPLAQEVYTGYVQGEPSCVVKHNIMFRVWKQYDLAARFVKCFQQIAQVLFEHFVDTVCVPFTIMTATQGVVVTCTALPPLSNPNPVPTHDTGFVVSHIAKRIHKSLFLPSTSSVDVVPMHRGMDGRLYICDVTKAFILHDEVNSLYNTTLLRNHWLANTGGAAAPRLVHDYNDSDVATAVKEAMYRSVVEARKKDRKMSVDQLLGDDTVGSALNQFGANRRILYLVLIQFDAMVGMVKKNPHLSKRKTKLIGHTEPEPPQHVSPDRDARRKQSKKDEVVVVAEIPEPTKEEEDDGEEEQNEQLQEYVAFQSTVDLKGKDNGEDADDGEEEQNEQLQEYVAFQSTVDLKGKDKGGGGAGGETSQPSNHEPEQQRPQDRNRKKSEKRTFSKPVLKPKSGLAFLQGDLDAGSEEEEDGNDTEEVDKGDEKKEKEKEEEDVRPRTETRFQSAVFGEYVAEEEVSEGNTDEGQLTPTANNSRKPGSKKKEGSRVKFAHKEEDEPRQEVEKDHQTPLSNRKSSTAKRETVKKRQSEVLTEQPRQQKSQRGKSEDSEVRSPKTMKNKKKSNASTFDSEPEIDINAVQLCRQCIMTEMTMRTLKAIMRAESSAPENNEERFLDALLSRRVNLVNRLCHGIANEDPQVWHNVVEVMRRRFNCGSFFELSIKNVHRSYVIRNSTAALGCVYSGPEQRFTHFKPIVIRTSAQTTPTTLLMTLEQNQLKEAKRMIADEYETAKEMVAAGATAIMSLTRQCVLERCAYLGMLVKTKLSRVIADELYGEVLSNSDNDPYSSVIISALLMQMTFMTGDTGYASLVAATHSAGLTRLTTEADLPYKAERERQTALILQHLELDEVASALIMDSVRSAERLGTSANHALSSIHMQRLLQAVQLSFLVGKEKNAEHCVHNAIRLSEDLEPVEYSRADVSEMLLAMPVSAATEHGLQALKRIAEASVSFHECHNGKFAVPTCTARNILSQLYINAKEDMPPDLRGDVLVGLSVLEGDTNATTGTATEGDVDLLEENEKEALGLKGAEQRQPEAMSSEEDEEQQGKRKKKKRPTKKDSRVRFQNDTPEEASASSPAASPSKLNRLSQASSAELKRSGASKNDLWRMATKQAIFGNRLSHMSATCEDQKLQSALTNKQTMERTETIGKDMRLHLQGLSEREQYWHAAWLGFMDIDAEELAERQAMLELQEDEQRQCLVVTVEQLTARKAMDHQHVYVSHFITWREHDNAIQLFEHEERHRVMQWERSDWRRIAVREEFLHRTLIAALQKKIARLQFLTRWEYLGRVVINDSEREIRQQLSIEAKARNLFAWQREESKFRHRHVWVLEQMLRRQLYHTEELAMRRHLEQQQVRERVRAVKFMRFVGLEFALRGTEHWENIERKSKMNAGYQHMQRGVCEVMHLDWRLAIRRHEVEEREAMERHNIHRAQLRQAIQYCDADEAFHRMSVRVSQCEHAVFAAEVHEVYVRELICHDEIVEYEREILFAHKKERMDRIYTPAMKALELMEYRQRRLIVEERDIHELLPIVDQQQDYVRELVVERSERRERAALVEKLREALHATQLVETLEFYRIEKMLRVQIVRESGAALLRIVARQEEHQRVVTTKAPFYHGAVAFLLRQEEAQRAMYIRAEHTAFVEELAEDGYILMLKRALTEEAANFRTIHTSVQREIWDRVMMIQAQMEEKTLLVINFFETTIREQIESDWAASALFYLVRHAEVTGDYRRTIHCEEKEFQHRSAIEGLELVHNVFRFDAAARRGIELQEAEELSELVEHANADLGGMIGRVAVLMGIFVDEMRTLVEREQGHEWSELVAAMNFDITHWKVAEGERNAIALLEVAAVERIVRWSVQYRLLVIHSAVLEDVYDELHERLGFYLCEQQCYAGQQQLWVEQHWDARRLFGQCFLAIHAQTFHSGYRWLQERGFERIERQRALDSKSVVREADDRRYVGAAEKHHRKHIRAQEDTEFMSVFALQEATLRSHFALEEMFTFSSHVRAAVEHHERFAFLNQLPEFGEALEEGARTAIRAEEEDALRRVTNSVSAAYREQMKEEQMEVLYEEAAARVDRILVDEFHESQVLFRNLVVDLCFAVHLFRMQDTESKERAELDAEGEQQRNRVIIRFADVAVLMLPQQSSTIRADIMMEEGFAFRGIISDMFFVMHEYFLLDVLHARSRVSDVEAAELSQRKGILVAYAVAAKTSMFLQLASSFLQFNEKTQRVSFFVEETLEFRQIVARCARAQFAAQHSSLVAVLLLDQESTQRQALEEQLQTEFRDVHALQLVQYEAIRRAFIWNYYDTWSRSKLQMLETLYRMGLQGTAFLGFSRYERLHMIENRQIEQREEIARSCTFGVEFYWRKVVFFAQESNQRQALMEEHASGPVYFQFFEYWLRCRYWADAVRTLRGIHLDAVCSHGHAQAQQELRALFFLDVHVLLHAQEESKRSVLTTTLLRQHQEWFSEPYMQHVVLPSHRRLEQAERERRRTIYELDGLPMDEQRQRAAFATQRVEFVTSLAKKEKAWRQCVEEWDKQASVHAAGPTELEKQHQPAAAATRRKQQQRVMAQQEQQQQQEQQEQQNSQEQEAKHTATASATNEPQITKIRVAKHLVTAFQVKKKSGADASHVTNASNSTPVPSLKDRRGSKVGALPPLSNATPSTTHPQNNSSANGRQSAPIDHTSSSGQFELSPASRRRAPNTAHDAGDSLASTLTASSIATQSSGSSGQHQITMRSPLKGDLARMAQDIRRQWTISKALQPRKPPHHIPEIAGEGSGATAKGGATGASPAISKKK